MGRKWFVGKRTLRALKRWLVCQLQRWRLALSTFVLLGGLLSACLRQPPPGMGTLEFDLCEAALELPDSERAFQGLDGWFFFDHDLRESERTLEQPELVGEVKRALATQGVELVVVPIPSRGVVTPQFLYLGDPKQAQFSPAAAKAAYEGYLSALRAQQVRAVDVLSLARAFDEAGGQTYFKRDGHWTPEGSHAVAQEVAKAVRETAPSLPDVSLKRVSQGQPRAFTGTFLKAWLNASCGYTLPPEPLQDYALVGGGVLEERDREVVLAGSSFSIPPFYQSSLDVALQTEVLNASIGGGGALFPLETYLLGDLYAVHRPKVVVWEFPISTGALVAEQRRRLLAAIYGTCEGAARFQTTVPLSARVLVSLAGRGLSAQEHYLSFNFTDRTVVSFGLNLAYKNGVQERLTLNFPKRDEERNRGRFFTTLDEAAGDLAGLQLELPEGATGEVTVRVCRKP